MDAMVVTIPVSQHPISSLKVVWANSSVMSVTPEVFQQLISPITFVVSSGSIKYWDTAVRMFESSRYTPSGGGVPLQHRRMGADVGGSTLRVGSEVGSDVGSRVARGSTLRVGSEVGSEVGSRVALFPDFLALFPDLLALFPDFLALFPDFLDPPLALFVEIMPVLALDFFPLGALVLLFILEFLGYGISER